MNYRRIQVSRIHDIEENLAVASRLQLALGMMLRNGKIDTLTYNIVERVPRLQRFETCLLAATACRYSELQLIEIERLTEGKAFMIIQPKTRSARILSGIEEMTKVDWTGVNLSCRYPLTNYDMSRRAISKVVPGELRQALLNENDKTHIFRHLRATWMRMQGFEITEIKNYLGHTNIDSTRQYIHESLQVLLK